MIVPDEITKVDIAKIEMCGFMAIVGKESVEFDKTNLIDGSHNEVKQSIARAIDVMLCLEYENPTASLNCRHSSKDPQNKRQSYVKMHLTGNLNFVLDGEQSRLFHITRYFNKKDVNFVFTSAIENGKQKKQSIQQFHEDLADVGMLRWLDPSITVDCVPNGTEINQIILETIGLKKCSTTANTLRNNYLAHSMHVSDILELNKMFTERFAEIKDPMTEIRTLKCALITQQIDEIKEKYPGMMELGEHRHLLANDIKQNKLNKKLNVLQSIQDYRCKLFNGMLLAERNGLEKIDDPQRIARLNDALKEYETVYYTFVDQLTAKRAAELAVFQNQRARIEWHKVNDMRDPAQINDEIKKNDANIKKSIDIEKQTGITDEGVKAKIKKGLEAIRVNIIGIEKIDDIFVGPAQKVFSLNHQRLGYYKQCMHHEIEMAIARAEMEKFYASDNWLDESQIQALQKGHELLSVNPNEFREHFLGHIGQFIDVNTEFNILRVVLPILSKVYLSAFIFSRKDIAEKFVESFLAANPGKTILTFSKDECELNLRGDVPEGVSLDEKVLTVDTCRRYTFVQNFFRTFRMTADNKNPEYCHGIAIKGIYKIFNDDMYYDKDSMIRVIGAKSIDHLKAVVTNWMEMGKHLKGQLDSGHKKFLANDQMKMAEKQMIEYEIELNVHRLDVGVRKEKILKMIDSHKNLIGNSNEALKFKGECRAEAKVFHMKSKWLKMALNGAALEPYQPIDPGDWPDLTIPTDAELALFGAIERFAHFYAKGFPSAVYQGVHFAKFKEWVPKCEDIESPNLRIEPQPNAVSDNNIEQRIKRNSALEAGYEKLLSLRKEQYLLSEHIDFCLLGSVEELAQTNRADLRRQLDLAQQNFPPGVILPGSDINKITENSILFDNNNDINKKLQAVSATCTRNGLKANWFSKTKAEAYFDSLLKILESLNDFYGWEDKVLVFQLITANGRKTEYIGHENPEKAKWIRNFTVQELCADDTRLNFYLKSNETGDYVITDYLDIKRCDLVTLLHITLSRSMNPSLFILNNTIVGRSSDDVAEIIAKYRPHEDDEATAQLILFSRSDVDYSVVFNRAYKRIECRAGNHNRWNIIPTNH